MTYFVSLNVPPTPLITGIILLAAITGGVGRKIQGGTLFGGLPAYRPIAFTLYAIPQVVFMGLMSVALLQFSAITEIVVRGLLTLSMIACFLVPHATPRHGKTMDMGSVQGTALGDWTFMTFRFVIPCAVAGFLFDCLVYEARLLTLDFGLIAAFAACGLIPSTTYLVCQKLNEWKPSLITGTTVVSEGVYGSLYSATILFIMTSVHPA